jgi:hypothetical protein
MSGYLAGARWALSPLKGVLATKGEGAEQGAGWKPDCHDPEP